MKLAFFIWILIGLVFAGKGRVYAYGANDDSIRVFRHLDSIYNTESENNPRMCLQLCARQEVIANMMGIDTLKILAANNKGDLYTILGMQEAALKEYYKSLRIAEANRIWKHKAHVLYRIAMAFQTLGDFKQSNQYLHRSKQAFIAAGYYTDTVAVNYELGFNFIGTEEYDKGLKLIEENLIVARRVQDEVNIVLGLDNLSNICLEQRRYKKSLDYLLEVLKHPDGFRSNYRRTAVYEHLAEVYVAMEDWANARKYLAEAFKYASLINSYDWLFECYRLQAAIEEKNGNISAALLAQKEYQRCKDSVIRKDYENKVAAMTTFYELEQKRNEISLLQKDKQITDARLASNKLQRLTIILGSLLVAGVVIAAMRVRYQRKANELQVAFSQSLIHNQEAERQRISRELHDSVGQNILFIKNQLARLGTDGTVMNTIDTTIDEVRNISKALYPNQLDRYGISASVDALAEKVTAATGIFVSADLQQVEQLLSKEAGINIFRIIQECLNNVIKHADAKAVRITGEVANGKIILMVKDNGKGFEAGVPERKAQTSYGMLNMEERARMLGGKLEVVSGPGGTSITAIIPINEKQNTDS